MRRVGVISLSLLFVIFAVQTFGKAYRPGGNDLTSYLAASRALVEGSNPYAIDTPFPYIYPLFLALALIPLTFFPYGAAVFVWFALSVSALAWSLAWIAKREDPGGRASDAVSIAAIVLILLTQIVQNNLLNGQVNFVVLACCIGAAAGAAQFRAAAWWGAAIAIKILPLGLAPWWLLRSRTVIVLGAIAVAVALALVPVLVAGRAALDWTAGYLQGFVGSSLETGAPDDTLWFSVYGVVRLIAPDIPWLPIVCAAIVLGAAALTDARRRPGADDHVAFATYLAVIPLASPKSETHHLAFALPAAYVCALRLLRYRIPAADWRRRTALVAVALFLIGAFLEVGRSWWWFLALVTLWVTMEGMLAKRTE